MWVLRGHCGELLNLGKLAGICVELGLNTQSLGMERA